MKKKLIFAVLVPVILSGCIGATNGGISSDNRTMQVALADDPTAAYQANNALRADKDLVDNANITAVVYNRNLLLVGQAPTEAMRSRAESMVRNVKNVKRLYNQVTVQPVIGTIDHGKDAVITSNLRARMLTTTDLNSSQFKVVTENSVVYLMGLATRNQADKAVDVLRHSPGVKKVVTLVEYVE